MNIPSYYALFYKKDENSDWQSTRLDLPFEEWEDYCKKQNYAKYDIKDLRQYDSCDLQIMTDVVYYKNRYYLSNEPVEYPKSEPEYVDNFDVSMYWEDENSEYTDKDYEEIYNGIEPLWTNIETKFSANENMDEVGIVAEIIAEELPVFLENLKQNKHAIYNNQEYSPFKWLCWLTDDKVRIIHQDYRYDCDIEPPEDEIMYVEQVFDVIVDKDKFFNACENMLKTMKGYQQRNLDLYNEYLEKQHKK